MFQNNCNTFRKTPIKHLYLIPKRMPYIYVHIFALGLGLGGLDLGLGLDNCLVLKISHLFVFNTTVFKIKVWIVKTNFNFVKSYI